MNKIIITLVVLSLGFGAKAQQFPSAKQQPLKQFRFPIDSLTANKFSFKLPDNSSPNNLTFKLDSLRKQAVANLNVLASANIDNMPVARMQGNSNMPVVQTDRTAYNMPVAGMQGNRSKAAQTVVGPNLPFFGGKPPIYYDFKKNPNNTPPADNNK